MTEPIVMRTSEILVTVSGRGGAYWVWMTDEGRYFVTDKDGHEVASPTSEYRLALAEAADLARQPAPAVTRRWWPLCSTCGHEAQQHDRDGSCGAVHGVPCASGCTRYVGQAVAAR